MSVEDLLDQLGARTDHDRVPALGVGVELSLADEEPAAAELFGVAGPVTRAGFAELIGRAKATGQLRQDFVHQDLVLVLMANAGVVVGTREAAPEAWRRLVACLIEAFRAAAAEPLPAPPTAHEMYLALMRLQPSRD